MCVCVCVCARALCASVSVYVCAFFYFNNVNVSTNKSYNRRNPESQPPKYKQIRYHCEKTLHKHNMKNTAKSQPVSGTHTLFRRHKHQLIAVVNGTRLNAG